MKGQQRCHAFSYVDAGRGSGIALVVLNETGSVPKTMPPEDFAPSLLAKALRPAGRASTDRFPSGDVLVHNLVVVS